MKSPIVIGSRGSDLALWQAHHVQGRLEAAGHEVTLKIIKTQGDRIQHLSFDKMEGKGFFTKEIEAELIAGSIDLAVHSHKDLETTYPDGLTIAAVSEREDPSEYLLVKNSSVEVGAAFNLKQDAIVGTSSARRKSQLLHKRPDVRIKDLRGNVPTRIQKLRDQDYDAIMLAGAGVERLGLDLSDFHVIKLNPRKFVSAPAQGVLGLQIRKEDTALNAILRDVIHQPDVAARIDVERSVLRLLEGGCQLPLGAFCELNNGEFELWVAQAESWDAPVNYLHLLGTDGPALAEEAIATLNVNR